MPDTFSLRNGLIRDALVPFLINSALQCAITRAQVNWVGGCGVEMEWDMSSGLC